MDSKNRNCGLVIGILAVVFNLLVSAFAYSFVGGLGLSFGMRWLVGFLIMVSPMLTTWAVVFLWKKEKAEKKDNIE